MSLLDGTRDTAGTPVVGPACVLCDAAMVTGECERGGGRGEPLVHCTHCGLFLRKLPSGALAPLGDGVAQVEYPDDGAEVLVKIEESSFWFAHRNRVLELLLERFPPRGRLWDVGGGNGYQGAQIQRTGVSVVVVEPGPVGATNARKRGVQHVIQGTLEALALPDASIHAISLLDVIEHLPEPRTLLRECARVLEPQGRLYVTVPAYALLWSDEDIYARHQRRYTQASLRRELERAGFEIELLSSYFQPLFLPVLLLRTLPYRLTGWAKGDAVRSLDASEHQPGPASRRVVDYMLARELEALRRGETLQYGTSVLAVARRA